MLTLFLLVAIPVEWVLNSRLAPEHEDDFVNLFGKGITMWRCIIWIFIGFFAGKFAIKRLILHTRPPERAMAKRKK